MSSETKQCQNCKNQFTIKPEDFTFYGKIKVPAPTFCPECRLIRRLAWRNERTLHHQTCALCGKKVISVFSQETGLTIYCVSCWWSDKWDGMRYGTDYDPSRPFFPQLRDLLQKVPLMNLYCIYATMVNSDYVNMTTYVKDCYLCTYIDYSERCLYSSFILRSKDSVDCLMLQNSELCYESVNCHKCFRTFWSRDCEGCYDMWYSRNCVGCSNCFGCVNLVNKNYHIFNKQYSKEEYGRLKDAIVRQMRDDGEYGQFFPVSLSPFGYNETTAQEFFPLAKKEALEKGYAWRDPSERNYQITIESKTLPEQVSDVKDSILNDVIGCGHEEKCNEGCTCAYRIIPQELEFYRKMNLPLPRLCPNCRHYQRIKQRNPLKLWRRKCQCAGATSDPSTSSGHSYRNAATHRHGSSHCPEEFETSYDPERPEIVYCEECYQQEVV